jgi:hypothetical protein
LIGVVFGLVIGWLKWDAEYARVLEHFSSRIHWGIVEFVFSLVLMAVYAAWLSARPSAGIVVLSVRSLLALLAATNLLYHFPPLFTLIANVSAGRIESQTVDSAMFRRLIATSEVFALTTHFFIASFAITGTLLIAFVWRRPHEESNQRVAVWGARIALGSTLLQIPIGLWLFMSLPARNYQRLMGGELPGSILFVLSMLAALSLLHYLSAISFGERSPRVMLRAILLMLLVVVAMTGVLQRLNQ